MECLDDFLSIPLFFRIQFQQLTKSVYVFVEIVENFDCQMFIAALCEHVFQMLFSGVTIAFFAFRKGADDIPFQNHVADWEIFFVGRKVHIIKTGQDIVVSRYFFLCRLAASGSPKEHNGTDRAFAGRKTAEHRNDGQQIPVTAGGEDTHNINCQRQCKKQNRSYQRCFFLICKITVTALSHFPFHRISPLVSPYSIFIDNP